MTTLWRIMKFAVQDMGRNFGLSSMTVLILVLMLLSINTLIIINVLTAESVKSVKNQIDVSIYFNVDATDKQMNEIKTVVKSFPEVTDTQFFDRDQVLAQFKEQHKDNQEILASLNELGDNPLGATLVLKTREPGDYQKVIKALEAPEYASIIEAKTFGDTEIAIQRIEVITSQVENFCAALSALFAVIAFLIVLNTVRVAIYTQRIEITIKKLVGATNWFVRAPYLFESLIFALISVLFSLGVILLGSHFLDPYVAVVFGRSGILTSYYKMHILMLLGTQFLAVLFLTIFSSLLAMRKYLRA